MFDPDLYRKTCSESLRLSEEKLEEMIFMTENKKHGLRRPLQIALIAAALVCMMCVTAAAANPEAVRELWQNITVSISTLYDDGQTIVMQAEFPAISVDEAGGRTILTVDGERADITDDLRREGSFTRSWANEDASGTITVDAGLNWEVELTLSSGEIVKYSSANQDVFMSVEVEGDSNIREQEFTFYEFTDDDKIMDADYLPPEE